jgi:hypothetical protein
MYILNEFWSATFSILKANLIALMIVSVVYVFEVIFNLKIFIRYFTWRKSIRNAEISEQGKTVYYVVFCILVLIYDLIKGHLTFNDYSISFWLIEMTFLTIQFHKFYSKYQGVDPNKEDTDFS